MSPGLTVARAIESFWKLQFSAMKQRSDDLVSRRASALIILGCNLLVPAQDGSYVKWCFMSSRESVSTLFSRRILSACSKSLTLKTNANFPSKCTAEEYA